MDSWQLYISNLLFLLFLLVSQVYSDCLITKAQFNETKAVITIDGKYLRTSHIKTNQTLDIYPSSGTKISVQCTVYGNFTPDIPSFERKLNTKAYCPIIDNVVVQPLLFHSDCLGQMYQVGYKINGTFLELYRSCYDKVNYITRYAEAYIYPSKNIINADRPKCTFTKDGIMSGNVETSIHKINVTNTFSLLYNGKYDEAMQVNRIDRGHLIAADDFLTYDQKVATFKMVNVIPQFNTIQATGNWFKIEKFVRSLADQQNNLPSIYVQTGSYGVLTLSDTAGNPVEANLLQGTKFPVPAWMYKVVKIMPNRPIFAIITSNNPFARLKPPRPAICMRFNCPKTLELEDIALKGYYYCCDPASFNPYPVKATTTIQPPTKKPRLRH